MEAMAMQVPCIGTGIAGIPELIRHEVDGLLVPPADENELTAALRRLLDDSDLRMRLGISARKRIQEKFNVQRSLQSLKEIFLCRL
jgi:glycosyltransferase involved in cell wall biosynthesis